MADAERAMRAIRTRKRARSRPGKERDLQVDVVDTALLREGRVDTWLFTSKKSGKVLLRAEWRLSMAQVVSTFEKITRKGHMGHEMSEDSATIVTRRAGGGAGSTETCVMTAAQALSLEADDRVSPLRLDVSCMYMLGDSDIKCFLSARFSLCRCLPFSPFLPLLLLRAAASSSFPTQQALSSRCLNCYVGPLKSGSCIMWRLLCLLWI